MLAQVPRGSADESEFVFAQFQLLPKQRKLLADGVPVQLGSRAFDILLLLVEQSGRVVGNDEIFAHAWPGLFVDETNLRVTIARIRKALGESSTDRHYIVNVPNRGYSFVAPVTGKPLADTKQPAPPKRLPARLLPVIGREGSIAAIAEMLENHRFVTVTGPGGIGKTTVAIAVAEARANNYQHGVAFVDLGTLFNPDLVASTVAAALNLPTGNVDVNTALLAFLRDRQMLLVLDCCEPVIDAAAALIEMMLKAAADLHVLATSREPLRAEAEQTYLLPPMESPPEQDGLTAVAAQEYPAVRLFIERAAAAQNAFELKDQDVAILTDVCRRLDGIPLAIELAAPQVAQLGLRGLAARLDDRFSLLLQGRRTALPRHQTLRATLDWSYDLLPENERTTLRRVAIFAGDFTAEAAAAMSGLDDDASLDPVGCVVGLSSKSLITIDTRGDGQRIYRLLDTTRAYARERLRETGEFNLVARRHATYLRGLLERAKAEWSSRPTSEWRAEHGRQVDDLRSALDWLFSPDGDVELGMELTIAAVPLWMQLSLMAECRQAVEIALSHHQVAARTDLYREMQLHSALAVAFNFTRGQVPETAAAWKSALAAAENLGDTEHKSQALYGLWNGCAAGGALIAGKAYAAEFQRIATERSDAADRFIGERMIGSISMFMGHQVDARRHLETMLKGYEAPANRSATMRHQFDQRVVAQALLARVYWFQGLPDQATSLAASALGEALEPHQEISICYALVEGSCPVSLANGDFANADRLVTLLLETSARHGLETWHVLGRDLQGQLLIKRGDAEAGLSILREALGELRRLRLELRYPASLGTLADGYAATGQLDRALSVIDQALALARTNDILWCYPELLNIKGRLTTMGGNKYRNISSEGCFRQAFDLARRQGAVAWQLRSALMLARLYRDQGRRREAGELLRSVYDLYTEGFATADLVEAHALIAGLA